MKDKGGRDVGLTTLTVHQKTRTDTGPDLKSTVCRDPGPEFVSSKFSNLLVGSRWRPVDTPNTERTKTLGDYPSSEWNNEVPKRPGPLCRGRGRGN